MLFRHHPKLTFAGAPIWPHTLAGSSGEGDPCGEVPNAVLKSVKYIKVSTSEGPRLMLEFTCGGKSLGSMIKLDNSAYIMPLFEWLKNRRGKTVQEIGESEVDL
jgi:hypothetical protein